MADYSNFPFGDFTVAEVFALARESKEISDDEFVKACMEAIRLNKCRPTPRALDLRPCGHKWESTLMNSITGEMSCAECASQ